MIPVIIKRYLKYLDEIVYCCTDIELYSSLKECANELIESFESGLTEEQIENIRSVRSGNNKRYNWGDIEYSISFIPLDFNKPVISDIEDRYEKAQKEVKENSLNWFDYKYDHLEDFRIATEYNIWLDNDGNHLEKYVCTYFGVFSNIGEKYDLTEKEKQILG